MKECSKTFKKPSQIHVKSDPETFKNQHSKNSWKKDAQIDKKFEFGLPTGSLGGGPGLSVFVTFSSPGVPWTPLGSKWSRDLPQEPPGLPQASFSCDFYKLLMIVLGIFCRFGAHSWHGGGGWPAGQLDNIYIYIHI